MKKWIPVVLALGLASTLALAQIIPTQIVSFNTAKFMWDAPDPTYHVTKHTIYCRTEVGNYTIQSDVPMPDLQVPVASVLPGPGIYVCAATATNVVGESGYSVETNPFAAIQSEPGAPQDVIIVEN